MAQKKAARRPKPQVRLIDDRSRVAMSQDAMEALGVVPGDYVVFEVRGREVLVRRASVTIERPA